MPHYTITKIGQLIAPVAGDRSLYPTILDQRSTAAAPGDWWVYHSTDHTAGGIYLTIIWGDPAAPTAVKSYTQSLADGDFDSVATKPSAEPIYNDSVEGVSTESPCVRRLAGGSVYLSYHNLNAGVNQSTAFAVDPTGLGLMFVRRSTAPVFPLDAVSAQGPGDGHDGYFVWGDNPFGTGHTYAGYSLHGGGDTPKSALWVTNDPAVHAWERHKVLARVASGSLGLGDTPTLRYMWHHTDPADWKINNAGELVGVVKIVSLASGASSRTSDLYEVTISDGGDEITRVPRLILSRGGVGSPDEDQLGEPRLIDHNGNLRLIYTGVDANNDNSLMVATVTWDPGADPTPLLRSPTNSTTVTAPATPAGLPSGMTTLLTGGATASYGSGAITITPSVNNFAELRLTEGVTPRSYEMVEAWFGDVTIGGTGPVWVALTPDDPNDATVEVESVGFLTFASRNGRAQMRVIDAAPTRHVDVDCVASTTTEEILMTEVGHERPAIGVRWWPHRGRVEIVMDSTAHGVRVFEYTPSLMDLDKTYNLVMRCKEATSVTIGSATLTAHGSGTEPVTTPQLSHNPLFAS